MSRDDADDGVGRDEPLPPAAAADPLAGTDPGATISPAALEVARTLAAPATPARPTTLADLPLIVTSDAPAAPGARAPDLVITGALGKGGMGRIDLGRQTVFDRDVAVKRVQPERLCDASVRALLAEARLAGALDHPSIVPVHLLGRSDADEPILIMKRVEGVTWRALARAPRADGDDWLGRHLEILRQVCNAAEFAHRHGVIHRDIKLDNVMVGELGAVYLLDWGIAVRGDAPPSDELAGTPSYMAPEMLSGGAHVTARTDVYLLGATLHELLTGRPRHRGRTIPEVLGAAARSEPFAYDASVPAELGAIANRATARDPDERFPSALAFSEAIGEFLRHRGSLELSAEAERLLQELRAALVRLEAGRTAELTTQARRTATECAFGFRQALRAWADNRHAREGLRACIEAAVALEIGERNAPGAELLLGELDEPSPALAAEIARLRRALAEEALAAERLAQLERDNDTFLDGSTGGWSPFFFSLAAAAVCIALSRHGARLSPAGYLALSAALVLVAIVMGYANRKVLVFNRASGRRALVTFSVLPFNLVAALVGYVQDTPVIYSVQIALLGQSLMAAAVGFTIAPVVLIGVPIYLAGLALLVRWPQDALLAYGVLGLLQAVVNRAEALLVGARRAARPAPQKGIHEDRARDPRDPR